MTTTKPVRWTGSDDALRAVQVAFDVEQGVLNAVRRAAFDNDLSTSDQIRQVLRLSTSSKPKRPRLTVSLTAEDYATLGERFGLEAQNKLEIKERVVEELIRFSQKKSGTKPSKVSKN